MPNTVKEKELKKFYNKNFISKYHKKPGIRYENIFSKIKIKNSDKILDIGCGNGLLFEYTHKITNNYCGVDFSKEFIEECKTKFPKYKTMFFCEDINKFCKNKQNFFSKAFMLDFTEHVYDKDLVKIFKSSYSALANNGKLIIHTPNGEYFLEILKKHGIMKQIPEHIAVRNKKQYIALLKDSGFNNIKTIYLPHYNILRHFDFLKIIPLIGKFFKARLLIIVQK